MSGSPDRGVRAAVKHVRVVSLALVALGTAACGSAAKEPQVRARAAAQTAAGPPLAPPHALPAGQIVKSDGDADNLKDPDGNPDPDTNDFDDDTYAPASYLYPDADDSATLAYGKAPSSSERRRIANVLTRYYAAATAADGVAACALIAPSLANSVPEDYASAAGPPYLRGGKTCAAVMTTLFKHDHSELSAPTKLLSIRVEGASGQAVLGSRTLAANVLYLRRQRGVWRVEGLLGNPLP